MDLITETRCITKQKYLVGILLTSLVGKAGFHAQEKSVNKQRSVGNSVVPSFEPVAAATSVCVAADSRICIAFDASHARGQEVHYVPISPPSSPYSKISRLSSESSSLSR